MKTVQRSKKDELMVVGGSLALIGSFFWVPVGLSYYYKKKCTTKRRKIIFFALLLAVLTAPMPLRRKTAKFWLWKHFVRYFSAEAVGAVGKPGQSPEPRVFAVIPHGIFPFGIALTAVGDLNESAFSCARPVIATAMSYFPILGHILQLIGAVKANPASIRSALAKGQSLSLSPGGIGEIFWGYPRPGCHPDVEYALLKSRKGFVRAAMEQGTPLVPVYCFGNSKTFHRAHFAALEWLSRLVRASLVLFWGRLGLPIPFHVPILFALGEPLEVVQNSNPTRAEVDELHARFCQRLIEVFECYKESYGWGHKTLEFV